jgi:hypothetical protein
VDPHVCRRRRRPIVFRTARLHVALRKAPSPGSWVGFLGSSRRRTLPLSRISGLVVVTWASSATHAQLHLQRYQAKPPSVPLCSSPPDGCVVEIVGGVSVSQSVESPKPFVHPCRRARLSSHLSLHRFTCYLPSSLDDSVAFTPALLGSLLFLPKEIRASRYRLVVAVTCTQEDHVWTLLYSTLTLQHAWLLSHTALHTGSVGFFRGFV